MKREVVYVVEEIEADDVLAKEIAGIFYSYSLAKEYSEHHNDKYKKLKEDKIYTITEWVVDLEARDDMNGELIAWENDTNG